MMSDQNHNTAAYLEALSKNDYIRASIYFAEKLANNGYLSDDKIPLHVLQEFYDWCDAHCVTKHEVAYKVIDAMLPKDSQARLFNPVDAGEPKQEEQPPEAFKVTRETRTVDFGKMVFDYVANTYVLI